MFTEKERELLDRAVERSENNVLEIDANKIQQEVVDADLNRKDEDITVAKQTQISINCKGTSNESVVPTEQMDALTSAGETLTETSKEGEVACSTASGKVDGSTIEPLRKFEAFDYRSAHM